MRDLRAWRYTVLGISIAVAFALGYWRGSSRAVAEDPILAITCPPPLNQRTVYNLRTIPDDELLIVRNQLLTWISDGFLARPGSPPINSNRIQALARVQKEIDSRSAGGR